MVSTIFTSVAQSSLYCLSDSSTPISFRSICYFNRPNFSSNFPTSTSLPIPQRLFSSICFFNAAEKSFGNFYLKESGLNWFILKRWRWHVPWQWQTASFTSLACGLSSVSTGLAETAAIPLPRIKNNELNMDQKTELLFLDQCITTAVVLGVICTFTNIFQLLPQDILGYDLREPFDIQKGWILWEATCLMVARLVALTRFSMSTFSAQREFLCRFLFMHLAKIDGSHAQMSSICCSFAPLVAQWKHSNTCFLIFFHSKRKISFVSPLIYCSNNESISRHSQLGYDPSEELLGIEADPKPRNGNSSASKPKSWFGPNGQYIKELPCPSCRGRGYTPCTECGIERSRLDCPQCSGKGIITCHQCLGDCVIWEESIDEQPWEKARSISPLIVKEDDEVDNLEIKLDKKKSKRVYQSPRPEVGLKISRSLKSLNAKTGLFSKRMKIIHRNPVLRAQRVAAIKKAKGTAAARKHTSETLKAFFSDPENRHKRSLAMKGVKFFCKNCGREGHRKHYCPELKEDSLDRRFRCRLCGEKGHNRRTCPKSKISSHNSTGKRCYHCKICHQRGHNRRTCPKLIGSKSGGSNIKKSSLISNRRLYTCLSCGEKGHNVRTCANRYADPATVSVQYEKKTNDTALEFVPFATVEGDETRKDGI